MVEHPPSKHEALRSNHWKKTKKRERKIGRKERREPWLHILKIYFQSNCALCIEGKEIIRPLED
jgi:hypothetical protein